MVATDTDALWVVCWSIDRDGGCNRIEPHWRRITGRAAESALGRGWRDAIHPEDRDRVEAELAQAARSARHFQIVFRLARAGGGHSFAMAVGSPQRDADGGFGGYDGSIIDLHDRVTAEQERECEQRFRSLFETCRDGIVTMDMSGRILDANPAYQTMLGYTLAELRRLTYEQLTPPQWRAMEEKIVQDQILRRGESAEYEKEYIRKDGGVFPISLRTWTVLDERGRIIGMRAFIRDITERKRAEAALRASERRFRAVFDQQFQYSALLSADRRVVEINQAIVRETGVTQEEVAGKPFLDGPWWRDLPEMRARWRRHLDEALTRPGPSLGEGVYHALNGELRYAINTVTALRDERGEVERLLVQGMDITERKRSEEALLWHMRRNELLSETAAQLLASEDPQHLAEELCGKVMAFLDCDLFFNYVVDENVGRLRLNACGGVSEEQARELEWLDFGAAVCGCVASSGERIIAENVQIVGDLRTERVRSLGVGAYCCHPLLHQDRVIGTLSFGTRSRARFGEDAVAVMKAVTDLVAIAMRRVQTENELRDADRRKDEFLATLAHELRNPLAPIRNAVHILLRKYGAEFADAPLLGMVQRQVDHLVRLVDDLLEISRISRGKVDLRKENVAVPDILRHALESCQPLVDKKGHRLVVTLAPEPLRVFGDPVRLAQIAANIINNAAKYTPPGGRIEVEAAREGAEAVLRVRDNGVGISADMMPQVFDLFAQTQDQTRLSEGGLGIGLALVRKLLEMHGGRVEARSAGAGRGSEFIVRLPVAEEPPTQAAAERPAQEGAGRAARALIVDDDHDVADSFGLLLETLGASVRKAYDGPAGVAAVDAFEPDIVFVDIGMPGVDGYETARRMRASAHRHPYLLVALTGWGQETDRRRAREAGFDLHLTKPAAIDAVEDLMRRVGAA